MARAADQDQRVDPQPDATRDLVVDDVMSRSVATVGLDDDLWSVLHHFHLAGLRHLVVVDAEGRFVSVLSDRVAADTFGFDRRELQSNRVRDRVLDRRTCIPSGSGLHTATREILRHPAGALAVVDGDQRAVGVITGADLLRASLDADR